MKRKNDWVLMWFLNLKLMTPNFELTFLDWNLCGKLMWSKDLLPRKTHLLAQLQLAQVSLLVGPCDFQTILLFCRKCKSIFLGLHIHIKQLNVHSIKLLCSSFVLAWQISEKSLASQASLWMSVLCFHLLAALSLNCWDFWTKFSFTAVDKLALNSNYALGYQ